MNIPPLEQTEAFITEAQTMCPGPWVQPYLEIRQDFEKIIGQSIYNILPGVVENTFESNLLD